MLECLCLMFHLFKLLQLLIKLLRQRLLLSLELHPLGLKLLLLLDLELVQSCCSFTIKLIEAAVARFYSIRRVEGLRKKPSTSELLDWLFVLARAGAKPEDIAKRLPYLGILVKQERDLELLGSRHVGIA